MWRDAYGNTNSKLGWEIDHLIPVEEGGTDDPDNLQPLQWENHRRKDQELAARLKALESTERLGAAAA